MLVLSRKFHESIVIDGGIKITVVEIRGNQIRLGIEAPREVGVMREELLVPATREMVAAAV
jgi:carbon storage regulator